MEGWRLALLGLVAAVYLFLAVFRSAYASLSPMALRRILEHEGVRPVDSLGIRVAFDMAHHMTLIGGALFLAASLAGTGIARPYLLGGIFLGGAVLATQLIARMLALANPEKVFTMIWRLASRVYSPFEIVARPLLGAMERLRRAGRLERVEEEPETAAEEMEALIDVGREEGILEVEEGQLIRQVVEFHDRVVREAMTPRTEIVAIPEEATLAQLRDLITSRKHSRIPVHSGGLDRIVGVVHIKDLLECWGSTQESGSIRPLVRPAYFVPETKPIADLLREMQTRRTQIALVVDEYGTTAGLVTVEDLLEEIVGEIQEEHDQEEEGIAREAEGRFLLRGSATIDEMNEALGLELPAEGYDTVAGLVTSLLGRIPAPGEVVEHEGVRMEVVEADDRRVGTVRIVRRPPPGKGTA